MEANMNIDDLRKLQQAFYLKGAGYGGRLSLSRDQFSEALMFILKKGSANEYGDLFDKIDVKKEGTVDWDKFAAYMLLNYYEQDDRRQSTQVPQWKELRTIKSPHKDVVQKVAFLKNARKYVAISKEGVISMWDNKLKLNKTMRLTSESCSNKDLWVTSCVPLQGINKIAVSLTSKEIAIYELTTKLEFHCVYRIQGLPHAAVCIEYWSNPDNANHAILMWGDTGGTVTAIQFNSACTTLFERQSNLTTNMEESCYVVKLADLIKGKIQTASVLQHHAHSEWVRQVCYSAHLECFISCSKKWTDSLVLGWVDKTRSNEVRMSSAESVSTDFIRTICRLSVIKISQGVNSFDYHQKLNLIATAGVNSHVCLWNPYVVSKPSGVLRGHMASVTQVCFVHARSQLMSFSQDKVLCIWDVQLHVCIQRIAGIFPKNPDIQAIIWFDDRMNRLFLTFNADVTYLELKPEVKDRAISHDSAVIGAFFNQTYCQIVSASDNGTVIVWLLDTSQKAKYWTEAHGKSKLTALAQDSSETKILTGASDGVVKMWDYNGVCLHSLLCNKLNQSVEIGQILALRRSLLVTGWAKYITVFRDTSFNSHIVDAADWKGGQEHSDDILSLATDGVAVASGSYNGEIIVWNGISETVTRHLLSRTKPLNGISHLPAIADQAAAVDGGFDSHTWLMENTPIHKKSRASSTASSRALNEQSEVSYAVSCLAFLSNRRSPSAANLVSCGGSGWVRFWQTSSSQLTAEFVAHNNVGSITMAVDKQTGDWLVTGDADGVIKIWDITNYCIEETGEVCLFPPQLVIRCQLHQDVITSLEICHHNSCLLLISASIDLTVQLFDITKKSVIGTFGQEAHWRIEPYVASNDDVESVAKKEPSFTSDCIVGDNDNDVNVISELTSSGGLILMGPDPNWMPDPRAVNDPANYRINAWETTHLGKEYQEVRTSKRERRQFQTITNRPLPYLHGDKLRERPIAGPHNTLQMSDLQKVTQLEKPDFMNNPHKYFTERLPPVEPSREPILTQTTLLAAFDEKTVFPKYILDFEQKMRHAHEKSAEKYRNQAKKVELSTHVAVSGAVRKRPVRRSLEISTESGSLHD